MGKNKNKTNQQQYPKTDIDYEKLADAIVRANEIAHERKAKKDAEAQAEENKQWRKANHIDSEKQPKKFFQQLWFFIRFPFIRKKNMVSDRASYALQMLVIVGILRIFQFMFAILGIVSLIGVCNIFNFNEWNIANLYFICPFMIAWIIYGLLRMCIIEVDRLRDRQLLLAVLSAITSFVAMIITIVALFV